MIAKYRQRLIRETILQLKTGRLVADSFRRKFGVDILAEFAGPFAALEAKGLLTTGDGAAELSAEGFLQIDRHLPAFFEPQFVNTRYT